MNKDEQNIRYVQLPDPQRYLLVEPLSYNNPYNHKELHRHDYFEIVFTSSGAGYHNIDFKKYDIKAGKINIIYPGQVHLMKRQSADGLLLQFRKDIFEYISPLKHYNFYYKSSDITTDEETFIHLYSLAERIELIYKQPAVNMSMTRQKAFSYLQIILIYLIELQEQYLFNDKSGQLLTHYFSLLGEHISEHRKVSAYADMMQCSPDKLNQACKDTLGKNALEILHEELLLEIRRMLLLNELSLKEISYKLNFENQANFNAFIKAKTGKSPKGLQEQVLEIYK